MELTVTGRKKDVAERFRRHLEDKLDKIPQLAPRVRRTEVVLTHEANPRQAKEAERCEITCYVGRTVVRAEAAADEEYAAALGLLRAPFGRRALAATIDVAIWDRNARAAGLPLWQYLGGAVDTSVPAYASMLGFSTEPAWSSRKNLAIIFPSFGPFLIFDFFICDTMPPMFTTSSTCL